MASDAATRGPGAQGEKELVRDIWDAMHRFEALVDGSAGKRSKPRSGGKKSRADLARVLARHAAKGEALLGTSVVENDPLARAAGVALRDVSSGEVSFESGAYVPTAAYLRASRVCRLLEGRARDSKDSSKIKVDPKAFQEAYVAEYADAFADELDAVRQADGFGDDGVQMLISSIEQGANLYSDDSKLAFLGALRSAQQRVKTGAPAPAKRKRAATSAAGKQRKKKTRASRRSKPEK